MDKQTLSNYGWVVIVTMILAVMLLFATPFGTYIGDGIVNITKGYSAINEEAIDEDKIAEKQDELAEKLNTIETDATTVLVGDADGDGVVDMADASLIFGYVIGTTPFANIKNTNASDIDNDGYVTHKDYVWLSAYTAGNCKYESIQKQEVREAKMVTAKSESVLVGDVDQNGRIETQDVAMINDIINGIRTATDIELLASDIDGDGYVTKADYRFAMCFLKQNSPHKKAPQTNTVAKRSGIKGIEVDYDYVLIGDLDDDGQITEVDCRILEDCVSGNSTGMSSMADINGDHFVNNTDVMLMRMYLSGRDNGIINTWQIRYPILQTI